MTREVVLRGVCFLDLLGKPTVGRKSTDQARYDAFVTAQDNLAHLNQIREWLAQNLIAVLVAPRWVFDSLLKLAFTQDVWAFEENCSRTLIMRRFPYFYGLNNEAKRACLDDLALKLVQHFRLVRGQPDTSQIALMTF